MTYMHQGPAVHRVHRRQCGRRDTSAVGGVRITIAFAPGRAAAKSGGRTAMTRMRSGLESGRVRDRAPEAGPELIHFRSRDK